MEQSSGEGRSSTSSAPKKILRLFFFVILINTFVNLFLSKPTVFDLIRIQKLKQELTQKTKKELDKRKKLEFLKREIERNPREVFDMLVREYLMKVKEGEEIVIIKKKGKGEEITR